MRKASAALPQFEVIVTTHLRSYAKLVISAPDAKEAFKLALARRKNITEWFTDPVDVEKVTIFAFKELLADEPPPEK